MSDADQCPVGKVRSCKQVAHPCIGLVRCGGSPVEIGVRGYVHATLRETIFAYPTFVRGIGTALEHLA